MSNKEGLQKLIATKNRRLQKLREQQAVKGISSDPSILIEIEDLEAEIDQHETKLKEIEKTGEVTADLALSSTGSKPKPNTPQNSTVSKSEKKSWAAIVVPIVVALIGLVGVIFTTVWNSGSDPAPLPKIENFTYQVRVQAKDTSKNIPNAVVTIEVGGKAPLDGITDSTGLARIFVSASHAEQPGRLIVEADGYGKYRKEIDITEGTLPKDILLEPAP